MKNLRQQGRFEHCPADRGDQEQPVRLWVVGGAGFLLVACVLAVLIYSSRSATPETKPRETAPMGSTALEPAPPAEAATESRSTATIERDRRGSVDEGPLPLQVVTEAVETEDNEPPEFDPATLSDPAILKAYLRSGDPALADAVLQAASRGDKEIAARALLDLVMDGEEPRRLEVLQRLCASPYVDAATVNSALRTALLDSDSALVSHAVRELCDRSDASAMSLLSEGLDHGDLSTRQLIVDSIAGNRSAEPLLLQGLKDPDETVRSAAQAVLSLPSRPKEETKESL